MNKRAFLRAAAGAAALPLVARADAAAAPAAGPVVLTVSGGIAHPNRGPLDTALDQLMHKQGLAFAKARTFTFAELSALPAVEIRPTLEYDARPHALRGPAFDRVLEAAGAPAADDAVLVLAAFDGYRVELKRADARELGFIVATHIDGSPLPLGGLGPLWAVFDAERIPALAAKPLTERFAACPWGLYSIHLPGEVTPPTA